MAKSDGLEEGAEMATESKNQYIKASKTRRKGVGFTEEKLGRCIDGLAIVSSLVKAVKDGQETIAGGCRKRGLNMNNVRSLMYTAGSIYDDEVCGYGYGDDEVMVTGLEHLYCDVFAISTKSSDVIARMPEDAQETVEFILSHPEKFGLKDREAEVIRLRYFEEKTLKECGEILNVTPSRVRQIETRTLRLLRHPNRSRIMTYGLEFRRELLERYKVEKEKILNQYVQKKIDKDVDIAAASASTKDEDVITLESLLDRDEISLRACNALRRAGYDTLNYVAELPGEKIRRTRNLGEKSYKELKKLLQVYFPDWSE